jgi:hypothetical protein
MTNYKHPLMKRTIDGGYSGAFTITAGRISDGATMVSVDSELLGKLVLTASGRRADQGARGRDGRGVAAVGGQSPSVSTGVRHDAEPGHSRTAADLARRVRQLSDGPRTSLAARCDRDATAVSTTQAGPRSPRSGGPSCWAPARSVGKAVAGSAHIDAQACRFTFDQGGGP